MLALISALCGTAQAATHTVYENGSMSSTYVNYFKDIVSGIGFNDNYVAFRSGQYEYTMIVGDIEFNNGEFILNDTGKAFTFSANGSSYNSQYTYDVAEITSFSLLPSNSILYSDVGEYPQLVERGAKYEMLTAVLLCIAFVSILIQRIFYKR